MKDYHEYLISNFTHIKEISCYNHNYYVGIKRFRRSVSDLLFAESDDENLTFWYYIDSKHKPVEFGESYSSDYPEEKIYVYEKSR